MSYEHICGGCLADKGAVSECPECGWREGLPPESPLHLPPKVLLNGRYIIGRVLGHGGFGITYLARDISLNRLVAIKEYLPRDLATRMSNQLTVCTFSEQLQSSFGDGLEKFYEEAYSLTQFEDHPGVVSVRDYFKENGTAYMVMQYLEGRTFKQHLALKGGRVSYDTALSVMMAVMDALREVHNAGILHRDISPDNIYITNSKQIKLLDFGAARYAAGEHSKSLSVILKAGFAPEEQYRSKGNQGPWTDIYAVAATFYRAITGQVLPEALDRMAEDTLVPPSQLGVAIPQGAEQALLKALSVRAVERFQTVEEFQSALIGQRSPGNYQPPNHHATKYQPTVAVNSPSKQPVKQNNAIIAVVMSMFIIAIVVAGVYFNKQNSQEINNPSAVPPVDQNSSDTTPDSSEVAAEPSIPGRWPDTCTRSVTIADLEGLSAIDLDIMRNEIYARHGWNFQNDELRMYFNSQPWYQPRLAESRDAANNLVVKEMTPLEIQNATLILNYQKANNLTYYK